MASKGRAAKVALYGMMIGLAMIFSYIEALIPIQLAVPGVKLGLSNLVTIVGLYILGVPGTIAVTLLRIALVGMTFGNPASMIYSLSGGFVSLFVMVLCKRSGWFSQIGISILGGVAHNLGQLLMAAWVVENGALLYYFPVLMAAGTAAGAVIGMLGGIITGRIGKYIRNL